jgi:hypothetical protein
MFDMKTNISERLANAVDLLLDFATLGEYGLEPAARLAPACESRRRPHHSSQTGTRRETAGDLLARS